MIFPAREVKSHCDYVRAKDLVVGKVYFRVHFLDDDAFVPELLPRVFAGRNLFPSEDDGRSVLYFKTVDTSALAPPGGEPADQPTLECEDEEEDGYSGVVEFEDALDQLLECSLRRQAHQAHE